MKAETYWRAYSNASADLAYMNEVYMYDSPLKRRRRQRAKFYIKVRDALRRLDTLDAKSGKRTDIDVDGE